MKFPMLSNAELISALEPSDKPVRMVIDTDAYNEIDDQFALTYAIMSKRSVSLQACYAAPFFNKRSKNPEDGMNKSYDEINKIFDMLGEKKEGRIFKGAKFFLKNSQDLVATDAVNDLINRAMETKEGKPLYVVAIAALTNVATAIQLKPEIIKKIVVVWLGGHPYSWHTAKEYNLKQDIIASQVVFNSSVPLVHIPCKNVAEHLRVSLPEISKRVGGCGEIGEYLYGIFKSHIVEFEMLSKPLWDIVNIAYMVNEKWVLTKLVPRPALTNQMTWSFDADRPFCRVANHVNRDAIFRDFFEKISKLKRPLEIRDYILTKDVKKSGVGNV